MPHFKINDSEDFGGNKSWVFINIGQLTYLKYEQDFPQVDTNSI